MAAEAEKLPELSYNERCARDAAQNFADKRVMQAHTNCAPFSWFLAKPGTGMGSATVIATGGRLLVFGDACNVVCFGHYCRPITTLDHARGAIHWIGAHRSWEYVHEKAHIGSGRDFYSDDRDEAERDLRERILELSGEDEEDIPRAELGATKQALANLTEYGGEEPADVRRQLVHDYPDGWEWAGDIGRVIDFSVFQAWAALNRLNTLLEADHD